MIIHLGQEPPVPHQDTIIDQWLALPHKDFADHVRRAVRGGSTHSSMWTALAAHPVLAARVSGMLSALEAQMAGHRDEAMWSMWISQARQSLTGQRFTVTSSPAKAVIFQPGIPTATVSSH